MSKEFKFTSLEEDFAAMGIDRRDSEEILGISPYEREALSESDDKPAAKPKHEPATMKAQRRVDPEFRAFMDSMAARDKESAASAKKAKAAVKSPKAKKEKVLSLFPTEALERYYDRRKKL